MYYLLYNAFRLGTVVIEDMIMMILSIYILSVWHSIITGFPEPFTILKNLESSLALSHRFSIVHILDLIILAVSEVFSVGFTVIPGVPNAKTFVFNYLFVLVVIVISRVISFFTITSIIRTFPLLNSIICFLYVVLNVLFFLFLFLVCFFLFVKLDTRITFLSGLAVAVARINLNKGNAES